MSDILVTILALVVALLGAGGAGYALATARRAPAPPPDVPRPDTEKDKAEAAVADHQARLTNEQVSAAIDAAEAGTPSGLAAMLNERRPP